MYSLVLEGEARAGGPPAVDEADFLWLREVVVREAEGAQGGALARGVVEALEAELARARQKGNFYFDMVTAQDAWARARREREVRSGR